MLLNLFAFQDSNFTLNLLANGAHEAGRVVGLPQDCHHLTLHKFPAFVAGRAMKPLEVQGTQIVTVPHEEPALSHVAPTNCTHAEKKQVVTELNNKHSSSQVLNAFQLLFVGQISVRRLNTSDEITPLVRQMSG